MLNPEKLSVLIAIPCYGGQLTSETVSSLYNLTKAFERNGIFNELLLVANESLIPQGRSTIANIFVNDTKHTHLLKLDADVGFKADDVIKLFELETDFAVGAYPMKVVPLKYNFRIKRDRVWNEQKTAISVEGIGAGFCLITRKVFEAVAKNFPELQYAPDDKSIGYSVSEARANNSFHFYETYIDPTSKHLVSEDMAFCNRFKSLGGIIWLHLGVQLTHTGSHVFEGHDLSTFE